MNGRKRRVQAGVTLIEMLVVVTIIALFITLVGPRIFKQAGKAQVVAAQAQISNFKVALGLYKLATGLYPPTEPGLAALRVKPQNVNQWDGPYLEKDVPPDPWGRPYQYKFPGDHGDEPDIVSLGPDGLPSADDVVSWK